MHEPTNKQEKQTNKQTKKKEWHILCTTKYTGQTLNWHGKVYTFVFVARQITSHEPFKNLCPQKRSAEEQKATNIFFTVPAVLYLSLRVPATKICGRVGSQNRPGSCHTLLVDSWTTGTIRFSVPCWWQDENLGQVNPLKVPLPQFSLLWTWSSRHWIQLLEEHEVLHKEVHVKPCAYHISPQWGTADAEIKVPSRENTERKRSPFKAWSRSVYCHTCYAYYQEFLPCLFLPFWSIHLHFSKTSPDFFLHWLWLTPVPV